MELSEIEQRVETALNKLNEQEERYDFRPTHYNQEAWEILQEMCVSLSENRCSEENFKEFLRRYRDRCEISFIDFHIKVAEPQALDMKRMSLLFGCEPGERLLPALNVEERAAHRQEKIMKAMRLTMENKQLVSEKLRQQFTYLMLRTKDKSPALLAVSLNYETYNAHHKRLSPAPTVLMTNHFIMEEEKEAVTTTESMFTSEPLDNSSFESRLPPTQVKTKAQVKEREWNRLPIELPEPETPHELPAVIHEEFAAYCQELYEKTFNHRS